MVVIYFILFIISILFYILYEGAFSFYLFAFLLIVPFVLAFIQKFQSKRISVSFVTVQKIASRSSKIPVTLKISNPTSFPVANLIVEIEYYNTLDNVKNVMKINTPVFPKDNQFMTMHISGRHYGTIKMSIKRCKIYDMLKLSSFKLKNPPANSTIKESTFTIVPDFLPLENNISNYGEMGLETDEYSKHSKGDDPSEIFDIHEYADGDKISRIHWKLSAKSDRTMVKDYSLPIANSIVMLINLNIDRRKTNYLSVYDTIVESVCAISMHLVENDTPHKVAWYDEKTDDMKLITVTDDDSHKMLVSMLLQAELYSERDLSVVNYINCSEICKCGHIMYFSADYNGAVGELLSVNDLAYRYSYMLITDKDKNDFMSDEFADIVPIRIQHTAESIQDMCF